ncbi:MAG: serine/threonine-protein kinase [Myxococcota bacterium]
MLPPLGSTIDGFRLAHQLAAGGMGAVFEATNGAGESVAIKFLHPELAADADMSRRFHREASILRNLRHPSIVKVRGFGTGEFGAYTVMELLRGETLASRLARGPMELAALCAVIAPIGAALDAAHDHGVIHGDVKPANVFLVQGGGATLVDFGTSKVHGLDRLTRTGEVSGTPAFMAPELLTGEGGIDARIDVYALGALAYHALAGTSPFTERNPGRLLFQIVKGEGTPLAVHRPDLAPHVAAAIAQAMAKDRNERFMRASAFGRALCEG